MRKGEGDLHREPRPAHLVAQGLGRAQQPRGLLVAALIGDRSREGFEDLA